MGTSKSYTTYYNRLKERGLLSKGGPDDTAPILPGLSSLQENALPAYLFDYTQNKFLYISDSALRLLDVSSRTCLLGGLNSLLRRCHPEDGVIIDKHILPDTIKFYLALLPGTHSRYLTSYNFRIRTKTGGYRSILEQSTITHVSDENMPLVALGSFTDISNYSPDNRVVHRIEDVSKASTPACPCLNKTYWPGMQQQRLSKRESEILRCVSDGMESREIACKLSISFHTVNNHRRNIIKKTKSKNLVDLVSQAGRLTNGLYKQ